MIKKKFVIIGNPVNHSLSPEIHNYWFKKNNLNSTYEKREILENELDGFINEIRNDQIQGANVTVPYKQKIIPFLDKLSDIAKKTQSVNTIFKKDNLVFGENTDVYGFTQSIKHQKISLKNKIALILGAGGVVPSLISALETLSVQKIFVTNRSPEKIDILKKRFTNIEALKWGETINFDIVINATSVGLKIGDTIDINFDKFKEKKIFYDTIYNPQMTNFLKRAKENNHFYINGELMLFYQAQKSFEYWNNLLPKINDNFLDIVKND